MSNRLRVISCLLAVLTTLSGVVGGQTTPGTCLNCHADKQQGFNPVHAFAASNCVACHAGNAAAETSDTAHTGLIAFPGQLDNAAQVCGGCHAERVAGVTKGLMHSGRGMVEVTRQAIDATAESSVADNNLQSLGHTAGDSMLRKLCASCHLGQAKTEHRHNVMGDRGGGCLACHINDYPANAHPALTTDVSDARCFGCHSRSGRISLSYAGLAEIDRPAGDDNKPVLALPDGRPVKRMAADSHYQAGMSCIDCHTSVGLMGGIENAGHQRQAVDIVCADCHDNRNQTIGWSDWPDELLSVRKHIPFNVNDQSRFLVTGRSGTPLWGVELGDDDTVLHTRNTKRSLSIPQPDPAFHAEDNDHQRLTCAACHSQWAPQCFGCHMEYDPNDEQWDHVERKLTPGRWKEERSQLQTGLPALGVNENDQIEPFIPGMIMTIAHPDWDQQKFVRMFAPLSPHTIGKSRSCESCHRSSTALGLGRGELTQTATGKKIFKPANELLEDGLPSDAWTNRDNSLGGRAPVAGQRPLNPTEMEKVLEAPIH